MTGVDAATENIAAARDHAAGSGLAIAYHHGEVHALPPGTFDLVTSMEVIERAYIQWVLQAEGGNKTRAAEVLGIDPSTLYRKLNRYGIEV